MRGLLLVLLITKLVLVFSTGFLIDYQLVLEPLLLQAYLLGQVLWERNLGILAVLAAAVARADCAESLASAVVIRAAVATTAALIGDLFSLEKHLLLPKGVFIDFFGFDNYKGKGFFVLLIVDAVPAVAPSVAKRP